MIVVVLDDDGTTPIDKNFVSLREISKNDGITSIKKDDFTRFNIKHISYKLMVSFKFLIEIKNLYQIFL